MIEAANPSDRICWSFEEEAKARGISLRHLQDLVQELGIEVLQAGRRMLFDREARDQLTEAMRQYRKQKTAERDAKALKSWPGREQSHSTSAVPSGAVAYTNLLALTSQNWPKKRGPRAKPNSTVAPFTARKKP
jgi:hypothetical protein